MRLTGNPGRDAGLLYVVLGVLGAFSILYVPGKLIAPGDAAVTARNILASETLYRFSIVSGLISSALFVYLGRALYRLFQGVDREKAVWMVALIAISVAIGLALTANDIAALVVLRSSDVLAAFDPAEREALALLFLRVGAAAIPLVMIFWGLWLFPFGTLVMRSGFVPRILGVLLIVNGVAYLIATVMRLLVPDYADLMDKVLLLPELGEIWIMLWLVIKGVRAPAPAVRHPIG
ncbi:MAG TPA: DUF4386 domain-containing protein [Gemmatimonadota bacterium]|nr:DUF4386 domain-containing protein [Gemmatimonadota bacterium]